MARLSQQQKRRAAAAAAAAAAQIILAVADAPLLDEAQHVKVIDALHAYEKLRKLLACKLRGGRGLSLEPRLPKAFWNLDVGRSNAYAVQSSKSRAMLLRRRLAGRAVPAL